MEHTLHRNVYQTERCIIKRHMHIMFEVVDNKENIFNIQSTLTCCIEQYPVTKYVRMARAMYPLHHSLRGPTVIYSQTIPVK